MKKAWIENGVIRDVTVEDPYKVFHPDVAENFSTDVPSYVEAGWSLLDNVWTAPEAPLEREIKPDPAITIISPTVFKRRFTLAERTAIALARSKRDSTDPTELQLALALDIFFEDLDDPRLTEMDLTDDTVTQGLAFLVSVNIITQERADIIGAV